MPLALFRWAYHAHLAVPVNHALFVQCNGREGHISCKVQSGFRLFSYDNKSDWLDKASEVRRFTFTDDQDQTKEEIPYRYLYETVESKNRGFPAGVRESIKFTIVDLLTEVDNVECLKENSDGASALRFWAKEVFTLFVEWYRALNNDPSVPLPRLEESPVIEVWAGEKTKTGELEGVELKPYSRFLNTANPITSGVSKRSLPEKGIQELTHALKRGHELTLYKRLLLEARELAHLDHNYALSVVVSGTAFEVLVAQELIATCERRQITQLEVGPKSGLRMKHYQKAIQDGRLATELLVRFPRAICGVSLKTLPEYQAWFRDAYDLRNLIIHGGKRQVDETAARKAFEAVTAFADAIASVLSKNEQPISNSSAERKDSDRPRMIYDRHCFSKQVIQLDGNEYRECKFDACTLIYQGGQVPVLASNSFNNCFWRFENAAERTVQFMAALHRGGFRDLIEKSVQNICGGFDPLSRLSG